MSYKLLFMMLTLLAAGGSVAIESMKKSPAAREAIGIVARLSVTSAVLAAPLPPKTDAPLIARAKFFGNPSQVQGRLSPDGNWLSWIAPRDDVLNVWVAPASDPSKARPVTAEKTRPIRQHFWAPDSSMILFINDKGGDENYLLYSVDVATGAQRALTPFDNTRVGYWAISRHVKDRILVGLNNRDRRWNDVYSLDLASGQLALVVKNEGYAGFMADDSLTLRFASKSRDDGGADFFRVINRVVETEPFASVGLDDSLTTWPLRFTADGKTLYWRDSRGRDTSTLIAQDLASGRSTVLAQDPKADISGVLVDPQTGVVQAYSVIQSIIYTMNGRPSIQTLAWTWPF
jgi:hypothetical protein